MSGKKWTPEEEQRLLKRFEEVRTKQKLSQRLEVCELLTKEFKRSPESLTQKLGRLGVRGLGKPGRQPNSASDDFEEVSVVQGYKDEITRLRNLLRDAARETAGTAAILEAVRELMPTLDAPPLYKPDTKTTGTDIPTATETALIDLGDWHFGEKVSAERTRGWNAYNADIASRRIRQVVRQILKIKQRLELGGAYQFPEVVVAVGGDMGTGMVHGGDDIERLGEWNIIRASIACAWVLAQTLRDLAAQFPRLYFIGIVGNHGRLGRRKAYKEPDRTFDWLIYQMAAEALRDIPTVSFHTPISHSALFEVRGWRFFLTHGDEYKAQFSMPYYSIDRATGRMLALESTRGSGFHYGLIHHWHDAAKTPLAGGKNRVMPSLKGGDEFVLERFGNSPAPGQWLGFVHDKHGITSEWEIAASPIDDDIEPYPHQPWLGRTTPEAEVGVPVIYRVPTSGKSIV